MGFGTARSSLLARMSSLKARRRGPQRRNDLSWPGEGEAGLAKSRRRAGHGRRHALAASVAPVAAPPHPPFGHPLPDGARGRIGPGLAAERCATAKSSAASVAPVAAPPHPPFGHPLPDGARGRIGPGLAAERCATAKSSAASVAPVAAPPHPPFGHPLPDGARGRIGPGLAAERCATATSSPSPRRGEGWGEGAAMPRDDAVVATKTAGKRWRHPNSFSSPQARPPRIAREASSEPPRYAARQKTRPPRVVQDD